MQIKNIKATDKGGNVVDFNFADMKAQSDAGESYPFQVINETDDSSTYRQIDMLGVDNSYTAQWWIVDTKRKTISMGNDQAIAGKSVDYNDNVINCTGVLETYQII